MEKERKEQLALSIGFVAILLVFIFTLFHSSSSSSNDSPQIESKKAISETKTKLDYITISPQDLQKNILKKTHLSLIDVRPFDSYIQEHIIDSINIPLDEFPATSKINSKDLTIVIGQNNDDQNIKKAVDELKNEDFKNIQVLAGGIDAWKSLIGLTISYGDPKSFVDQTKVSYLNPDELHNAIEQQVPLFIVDVRTPEEYSRGHIQGAINLPFDEIEKKRQLINQNRVVVVGINELQEFQASVQLYDMLKIQPYVMRTAMAGWQEKGFSLIQ